MPKFLIDANLPRWFHLWAGEGFEFAHDDNPSRSDDDLWNYALANDLVIVTVDGDFHDRRILQDYGPKIIHFRLRNMRLRDWHPIVTAAWPKIAALIEHHRMVIVYADRIDAVP